MSTPQSSRDKRAHLPRTARVCAERNPPGSAVFLRSVRVLPFPHERIEADLLIPGRGEPKYTATVTFDGDDLSDDESDQVLIGLGPLHGGIHWAGALALTVRLDEPSVAAPATTALTACEAALRRPARAIEVLPTVDFERRRVTGEVRLPEPPTPPVEPPSAPPTWGG
jgi:hypothetical protein